jgi:Ankyrin repeats (many copies)
MVVMLWSIRFVAVAGMSMLVFGCNSTDVSQPPQFSEDEAASLKQNGKLQDICQAWDQKNRARPAEETKAGQFAIMSAVRAGSDPIEEADKAARSGHWGLIRTYTMMGTEPFGVDCADAKQLYEGQPLVRAYRVYSDVPGSCETFGAGGDCAAEGKLDKFAVTYNRALVARNDYPYRDICRIPQHRRPSTSDEATGPNTRQLGFQVLVEKDHPRTFPEAARRGNIRALKSMLASDPMAINRIDPYGMPPLHWAIRYGQRDAVEWLLRQGALPDGGECGYLRGSAFHLALGLRQEDIAARIYSSIPAARKSKEWSSRDIYVAAVGGSSTFLKRMLREPHDGVNSVAPRDGQIFSPEAERILAKYREKLCWANPIPREARVTLIAVHGGDPSNDGEQLEGDVDKVTVTVLTKNAPQMLVLSSYNKMNWHIKVKNGAKIAGVFVNSYEKQNVMGLDLAVPIVQNWLGNQCRLNTERATHGRKGSDLEKLQRAIQLILRKRIDRTVSGKRQVEI